MNKLISGKTFKKDREFLMINISNDIIYASISFLHGERLITLYEKNII